MSNAMQVLQVYRYADTWVFDDPRHDLEQEPFVAGVPEMLDELLVETGIADLDNYPENFRLIFSASRFPGCHKELRRDEPENGGWWYRTEQKCGWLCPALFHYFEEAPPSLFVRVERVT